MLVSRVKEWWRTLSKGWLLTWTTLGALMLALLGQRLARPSRRTVEKRAEQKGREIQKAETARERATVHIAAANQHAEAAEQHEAKATELDARIQAAKEKAHRLRASLDADPED